MSPLDRRVRSMPTWMLRLALKLPSTRGLWGAAYLELWRREVVEVVEAEVDNESGPWACVMPTGRN